MAELYSVKLEHTEQNASKKAMSEVSAVPEKAARREELLVNVRALLPTLNEQEQKVARYVLEHPQETVRLPINELARRTATGDATVLRFCKKVGTQGYGDFKIRLAQDLAGARLATYASREASDTLAVALCKSVSADVKAMEDTLAIADAEALVAASAALLGARRVDVYGSGGAAVAAEELQFKLARVGVRCMAHRDGEMQFMSASLLGAPDVAIGISHSGESNVVCEALAEAKAHGATAVAITNHPVSPLASLADVTLVTAAQDALTHGYPTGARAAQVALINMLCICITQLGRELAEQSETRLEEARKRRRATAG